MTRNRFVAAVAAACLFTLLPPAAAQTLYKSTMPDGRVVYGDKPAPGATKVEQTRPDVSKKGVEGTTAREQELLKDMEKARRQRESREDKVRAAEQKLKDAEDARTAGKEPLASERIGTAGGASRLNETYFDRQRRLEEAVEKARLDVDAARSGK